jgi:hypothetical protein
VSRDEHFVILLLRLEHQESLAIVGHVVVSRPVDERGIASSEEHPRAADIEDWVGHDRCRPTIPDYAASTVTVYRRPARCNASCSESRTNCDSA